MADLVEEYRLPLSCASLHGNQSTSSFFFRNLAHGDFFFSLDAVFSLYSGG